MALAVDLEEALGVEVRVALRRRERGVAEELLDGPEVRAGREEMRRERVPERVRRGVAGNRRRKDRPVEDAPHAAVRQTAGTRVQEHDLGVLRGGYESRSRLQPGAERRGGGLAERHDALLAPLPHRAHLPDGEIDVLEAQPHELGHAEPRRVEQLEERAVAHPEGALAPLRLNDRHRLAHGQRPGAVSYTHLRAHRLRRVRGDAALALEAVSYTHLTL